MSASDAVLQPAPDEAAFPDAPGLSRHASPEHELASLIVDTLQLEISPADIVPDEALFHEGLGLDSIDALELALAISRRYGIELKSDDPGIRDVFKNLRSLSAYVQAHRAI